MRKQIPICFASILLIAFSCILLAENPILSDYYIRNWGIENGLSQGTIPCMVQTPDGYIWLGNQESLSRFDGVRFVNYNTKNTPVLKSSWVQSMTLSREQHLIIGTWRGGIYEQRDNTFFPLNNEQTPELSQSIIYALDVTHDGLIWAGTSDGLFSIFKNATRRYDSEDGIMVNAIRSLLIDKQGVLWIGSQDRGLWRFNDGVFTHFSEKTGLKSDKVWALANDSGHGIWIGCGHILTHYDGSAFTTYEVPVTKLPKMITAIALADDGTVWLGMQNEGVWRFRNGEFSAINEKDGLSSRLSQSILIDQEKNIWVGTNGSGVTQLVSKKIRVISREEGLATKEIWTVMESDDGSLWIGTHGGGLERILNNKITNYSIKDGLSSLFVTALHQSPQDSAIWLGTENNGFMRMKNGTITQYHLGTSLNENAIYAISEQEDGVLLLGSEAGITFWKNDTILNRLTSEEGLSHNSVREFVKGKKPGEFWVATDIGLNLIRYGQVVSSWKKRDGLRDDALNGLYRDTDDHLWICTYGGGLIHFHNDQFTPITSIDGLHNDVVYDLIEDGNGLLWMSSNRGVFAVRKTELLAFIEKKISKVTSFALGIGDGLKALECNGGRQPAIWLTRSGIACFATINGVALLDTKQFSTNEPAPSVIFEQISINNTPIPLKKPLSIRPGIRILDVEFTSPFFSAPEKILFQYRLLPFEENWNNSQGARLAHYTNIPPGNYSFEARSSNRFGIWSRNTAVLPIEFCFFFHETLLFRILIILILITAAAIYMKHRTLSLEKSKKNLEQAVILRTQELKEAYDKVKQLSLTDTLTDLFNRRYFHNIINREIHLLKRQSAKNDEEAIAFAMAFLMIDIDHFKQINDHFGHLLGDSFLQIISKRFMETLRSSDLIVRWGGEEFLVLTKEQNVEGARQLCRRLLSAVSEQAFSLDHRLISSSISIGFCPFPILPGAPEAFTWEDAVHLADKALYQAKDSGRNCAVGILINPEHLNLESLKMIRENFDLALEKKLISITREQV